ncbi:LacI family transcriptional regulator [Falsiroseomonas bella]|uniref:LacI family transcriptional regulator n=1 Tax=Falsiroseomonas bella TaxID=2184016 RepID=A0A317FHJ1_9PROT|nr:substrate-binding domain-containing protein [Falsiroseomonas bella]PWS38063.1 LacI family transcriptional regulator [Falsiroseomonas bella]
MTRLRDLAQELGLSATTVSRALDGYPDVAEATRARVMAAARRVGYLPDPAARRLRRGRADTVAALIPGGPGVELTALLHALGTCSATLAEGGLDLMLVPARDEAEERRRLARLVARREADAFVILRTRREDARVDWLLEQGVPFVTHGRTARAAEHPHIDGDAFAGFRDALRHLAARGHRRIAHVAAPDSFMFGHLRRLGAMAGATEAGIALSLAEATPDAAGGHAAVRRLLQQGPPPTALLCATDAIAIGAAHALREAGLRPGHDVALWGHDNIPAGTFLDPPLASMEIADPDIGAHLARLLLAVLGGADPATLGTVLPLRHIPRASLDATLTTQEETP